MNVPIVHAVLKLGLAQCLVKKAILQNFRFARLFCCSIGRGGVYNRHKLIKKANNAGIGADKLPAFYTILSAAAARITFVNPQENWLVCFLRVLQSRKVAVAPGHFLPGQLI